MEPEQTSEKVLNAKEISVWNSVTPLSKYLAMAVFVALPFIGGYVGYTYSPEKVVEVEKVVVVENVSESADQTEVTPPELSDESESDERVVYGQDPETYLADVERIFSVDDWVTEIDRRSFSFQDIPGEVVHKCVTSQVFKDSYGGEANRCFGTNVISLIWNGEEIVVDALNTPNIESLFSIQSIFFNEGRYERAASGGIPRTSTSISTSSDKTSARLIISSDLLPCLGTLPDMCWGRNELSYAISLPEMESTRLNIQIPEGGEGSWGGELSMFNTRLMIWNEAGSKALLSPPAPAGCPGSVYDVLDLESQTIEMYRIEPVDECFPPPAEWLDNDTFRAGSSTISTVVNLE